MADFTIEKMLYRGFHDEQPQLYIILGRAQKAGQKIHVQFPELSHWSVDPPSSITATAFSRECLTTHDFLDLEIGQYYWEARFYVEEDPDLDGLFKWLLDTPSVDNDTDRRSITVEAWKGIRQSKINKISKIFSIKDLLPEYQFEVGVLLVHGIGPHRPRETLIHFGEPLVKFLDDWMIGLNNHTARNSSREAAEKYKDAVYEGVLHNRQDLYGINQVVGDFVKKASLEQKDSEPSRSPNEQSDKKTTKLGNARIDDTAIGPQQQRAESPNSSLLRLSTLSQNGDIQEAHILLSESWWTDRAVLPDWRELWMWIWSSFPIVLAGYINGVFSRIFHNIGKWKREKGIFNRFFSLFSSLFSLAGLLFFFFILHPITLVGCVLLQTVLSIIAVPALLPIPWVRKLVGMIIETLLSTVGQSYALKISRVRRSAIVASVSKDLDWLSMRCKNIYIIAHSQGAEVSRLALGGKKWNRIKGWITIGSGINPLAMLEQKEKTYHAKLINLLTIYMGLLLLTTLLYYAYIPVPLSAIAKSWGYATVPELLLRVGGVSYIILMLISCVFLILPSPKEGTFRKSILGGWKDFYASHDPVPNGPGLHDEDVKKLNKEKIYPEFHEIDNEGSVIRDHTTYFENREQFIAPLALEIAENSGINLKELISGDDKRLEAAKKRRHLFVQERIRNRNFTMLLSLIALGLILTFFSQDFTIVFHSIYNDLVIDSKKIWPALKNHTPEICFHWGLPLLSVFVFYLGEKIILQRKMRENYNALVGHRDYHIPSWEKWCIRFFYALAACGIIAYWWLFEVA